MESTKRRSVVQKVERPKIKLQSLEEGFLMDKYRNYRLIKEGGFAKVFRVVRKSDGKVLAAKCINLERSDISPSKLVELCEREIEILMGLESNFIVKLED